MFILSKRQRHFLSVTTLLSLLILLIILRFRQISIKTQQFFYLTLVDYRWKPLGNIRFRLEQNNQPSKEYSTDALGQIRFLVDNSNELIEISINDDFHQFFASSDEKITIRLPMFHRNTSEAYDDIDVSE